MRSVSKEVVFISKKKKWYNTKSGAPVDQKYEYLKEDPIIKSEIDADTRPIVGLEHTCEIRRLEQMPIYSCFLCSATLPNSQRLIEHMLGLKHRQAFLKEHDPEQYKLIQESQLRKCHLESIIEECIVTYEKNHGRGKMIVKKEKDKTASCSYEKGYSSDHDSNSNHKYSRHERSSYSEWKTISSCAPSYYKRERHSSDYRSDSDIDHYYSKEEPHSRSEYYRTALGKEASPPRSVRNISGSRYYSKEEPESRSTYYQRASVKEAISPNIVKSVSDSRYYSEEEPGSRSSFYQSSLVNEISPPQIRRSVGGSGYYSEEAPESRSTYYQSAVNEANLPKIVRNVSGSSHLWADEHEKVDLRDILQQKKSLGTSSLSINNNITSAVGSNAIASSAAGNTAMASSAAGSISMPSTASLPPSSSVTNISESMLKFINDLTPEAFFHLALFKLDNMEIHEEKYVKLLDCLISRATVLSCDIKKNKIFPSLQAKFHESMAQNGIYPQNNADFDQNLNNLIQHYKSQKSLDKSHNQFQNSEVLDRSDLHLSQSNSNYYPAELNSGNYSRCLAPSGNTSTSLENMGNQNSNLIPFKGFSSTPSSIPGLTFGEEINSQPQNPATEINQLRSPFEHLSENAKNILGYFNRPLSKDYNHH
ncbi:uncharacterized protein TNCT_563831 [Trichonephila clavata]|uniref:C2H2-type domain-containing protein n=1 Tax=Trichonephila clavata TaxID=2740835 RepID=A0A8X6LUJ8_TRICU|nr:uncharacterized protein TNCT_563831 [Trichonephila clavata]